MSRIFDLTENPFAILGVSIRSRQDDIASAYEDALSDHKHPETVLGKAQQTLLTPKMRLEAELTWLPSTAPGTAKKILQFIEDGLYDDAAEALEDLTGLDKANLAADLCCRDRQGVGHADALISAYSDIDIADILKTLSDNRSVSGFSRIDQGMLETSLANLRKVHAKSAMAFLKEEVHPAEAMLEVVEDYNDDPTENVKLILSDVAREYDAWSEVPLRIVREKIHKEIESLRSNPHEDAPYDKLTKLLDEWDVYSQPMQLIEEAKGHDEPKSRALYEEIRNFCVWLANDEGLHDRALRISRDMQRVFPELPSVAIKVQEDVETLGRLAEQSGTASSGRDTSDDTNDDEFISEEDAESSRRAEAAMHDNNLAPLTEVMHEIRGNEERLLLDIIHGGFSASGVGLAKKLFHGFASAVERSKGTPNSDMPWIAIINIANRLANENSAPVAAEAMLRGAITFTYIFHPSENMKRSILGALADVRVAQLMDQFKITTDKSAALSIAKQIVTLSNGEVKRTFTQVRDKLQSDIFWKWARRLSFAVVGIIIVVALFNNNRPNRKPTYTPSIVSAPTVTPTPPAQVTQNPPAAPLVPATTPSGVTLWSWLKDAPPGVPNAVLSRDQLRYCMFQGEVIDSLRLMITDEINDKFNSLVIAYNKSCAEFRYYERDMTVVNRELKESRGLIHAGAVETKNRWLGTASNLDSLLPTVNDLRTFDGAINVQMNLYLLGHYNGNLDGQWGPASWKALRSWKKSVGLPVNDQWTREVERKLMGD